MASQAPQLSPVRRRRGAMRDRRGRGARGPLALPGPLSVGCPVPVTARRRFDDLVIAGVERIESRWRDDLSTVEFGVEDVPPVELAGERAIPLAALMVGSGSEPTRIVVFRRPVEARAVSIEDQEALVYDVLVEQVAELLGRPPEEIDPG